jgi:predicted metal-dependent hydrolase
MSETLAVENLVFEVRRSSRRKTLGITVDRGGELVLHAPESSEITEVSRWTRSKLLWVYGKLLKKERLAPRLPEPDFVSGENFWFLGRNYRLKIMRGDCEALSFDGRNFRLRANARSDATNHFRNWYVHNGREWLRPRVRLVSRKLGVAPARVNVRDLGYRWGSCGKNAALYFDWKLLQLPARVIDYVIAHELAHLLEPHHGPRLWRILDRSLPDWRDRSEELRIKARDVYWCHDRMNNH